jgi:hypothetical protein
MTIANYGELKSDVSDMLFHQRLVARYPLYVKMFETDANTQLRVRQMEAVATLTTSGGEVALPADYLVWRSLRPRLSPSSGPTFSPPFDDVDYVHPAYLPPVGLGFDNLFTIENGKIKMRPVDDRAGAWELHYYQKIPTIVGSDGSSNWLLTEYPNAYLFGVMVEAMGTQRNSEMAAFYKQRRDEVLAEIVRLSALTTGATSKTVRTAEYF